MKKTILFFCLALSIVGCESSNKAKLSYKVIESNIDPNRGGYLNESVIVVDPRIMNEDSIRNVLNSLYSSATDQSKSKVIPEVLDIKIYESDEHFKSGIGQWLGSITKSKSQVKPSIVLNFPKEVQEEIIVSKFDENTRNAIWIELVKSQDKALQEAESKKLDLDGESELMENSRTKLKSKYNISEEELRMINEEAFKKKWALPAL